ncbi:TonB-dependent receptor plug domain-containing protein [Roseateles sp. BYS180W]|uniref:TonB-dependent receptor plug domain-containing protein n=1 Tax=Roseateles rivi TaxID=3299028 RepID=A0ABW7FYH2_9BURK
MKTLHPFVATAGLCLLPLAGLQAQTLPEPPVAASAPQTLQRVQVQGASHGLLHAELGVQRVVLATELLALHDTRLGDALARLPGVRMEAGRPALLGMGSGRTALFINGRRAPPDLVLDDIAPEQIARVEIIQGGSALSAGQGLAGSVNLVLRPAPSQATQQLKADSQWRGAANTRLQWRRGGPLPSGMPGQLSWGTQLQLQEARPSERSQMQQSLDAAVSEEQEHGRANTRQAQWAADLGWQGEGGSSLRYFHQLGREWLERNTRVVGLAPPPQAHPLWVEDTRYQRQRNTARLGVDALHQSDSGLRWQGQLSTQLTRQQVRFELQRGPRQELTPGQMQDRAWQASSTWDAELGPRHRLSFALQHHAQQRDEVRQQLLPLDAASRLALQAETALSAWALEDEITLSREQQLSWGWRQEYWRARSQEQAQHHSAGLPTLQWRWAQGPRSVRLGLSRSLRAPLPAQLQARPFTLPENTPLLPDRLGNPTLRPESAWALDAQFSGKAQTGSLWSLSAFVRRISQPWTQQTRWGPSPLGGLRWQRSPVNAQGAWVQGLSGEWVSPAQSGWTLALQAQWQHSRMWMAVESPLQLAGTDARPWGWSAKLSGPPTALGRWQHGLAWQGGPRQRQAPLEVFSSTPALNWTSQLQGRWAGAAAHVRLELPLRCPKQTQTYGLDWRSTQDTCVLSLALGASY